VFDPGCKTQTGKDRERGVTFLNLPAKNKKLPKKWLEQSRRGERFLPKKLENVYASNEHFTDICFKTEYQFELVDRNTRRSSKKNAFPTIFQRKALVKVRIASQQHIERKERKEVAISYTFHVLTIFLSGKTVVDSIW